MLGSSNNSGDLFLLILSELSSPSILITLNNFTSLLSVITLSGPSTLHS